MRSAPERSISAAGSVRCMRARRPWRSARSQPAPALRARAWRAACSLYPSSASAATSVSCQADPPAAVNDAFKEVTAAQQDAQATVNRANTYALQLRQQAQGESTAFDKVYEQYKLAPGVTKRRMYYETMERVLKSVDKTIVEAPGVNSYLPLNELRRTPPKEPAQ